MKSILFLLLALITASYAEAKGPVIHLPFRMQQSVIMAETSVFPNPFESNTTIYYSPSASGKIAIRLFTGAGRLVGELYNDQVESGQYYQFELNGADLNPGVYYYTIETKSGILHQRLELVR